MSQESWKQVRFDVLTGRRRKKSRHKLPTISRLCSCMAGQADDFPESSRPYERKCPVRRELGVIGAERERGWGGWIGVGGRGAGRVGGFRDP